jgi:hypothetical protein
MTVNQRNFARLAAQGAKLVDAHEQVYGRRKTRRMQTVEASKLADHPQVQEAIAEFERQLMPITDLRACKQRMISNIQYLAMFCEDARVRLAASIDLRNYCEEREQRERKLLDSAPVNLDHLLSEMASLRDAQRPATIEMEAVDDAAQAPPQPADAGEACAAGEDDDEAG